MKLNLTILRIYVRKAPTSSCEVRVAVQLLVLVQVLLLARLRVHWSLTERNGVLSQTLLMNLRERKIVSFLLLNFEFCFVGTLLLSFDVAELILGILVLLNLRI